MKTAIAMLALCGMVIGGAAWGHPCPDDEVAAVDSASSANTRDEYEALRPRYTTFEEAHRKKRELQGRHAYINTSYPSYKSEYMAWEILKLIKRLGRKNQDEIEALRPRYSTFEEAHRKIRELQGDHAYINTSYPAYKTEYILWEVLKLVRSEGLCK